MIIFLAVKKIYDKANEVLGFDLKELIFNGDKEELNILKIHNLQY